MVASTLLELGKFVGSSIWLEFEHKPEHLLVLRRLFFYLIANDTVIVNRFRTFHFFQQKGVNFHNFVVDLWLLLLIVIVIAVNFCKMSSIVIFSEMYNSDWLNYFLTGFNKSWTISISLIINKLWGFFGTLWHPIYRVLCEERTVHKNETVGVNIWIVMEVASVN